jgi:hypothetical protein
LKLCKVILLYTFSLNAPKAFGLVNKWPNKALKVVHVGYAAAVSI